MNDLNIALLSSHDLLGGAALSAHRLKNGLAKHGQKARMIVLDRSGSDPDVEAFAGSRSALARVSRFARKAMIAGHLGRYPLRKAFHPEWGLMGRDLAERIDEFNIVHMHAVTGFVDLGRFLPIAVRRTRIVWTLHDLNLLSGGCHADEGCGRWRTGCGRCPVLSSDVDSDFSARTWARKARLFDRLKTNDLCFITPSKWLGDHLADHPILSKFRREVIANGIDTTVFQPRPRSSIREALGIPLDARVLLFVSESMSQPHKGASILPALMRDLQEQDPRTLLLVAGKGAAPEGCRAMALGYVSPEMLPIVYNAADALILPSTSDNFPNTVVESFACGVPVAAYATGGIPEMVRSGETGWTVPTGDTHALLAAARTLLLDDDKRAAMGVKARATAVERFNDARQAQVHLDLFNSLLK